MNEKKVLIFDFDGTVVDSGLTIYRILNAITPKTGKENIDITDENKFRNKSSREIVKGLNTPVIFYPIIYLRFRYEYSKVMKNLEPVSGIPEVLKKLDERGIRMHIVSSSPKRNINKFLMEKGLAKYFKNIEVIIGFFGKNIAIKRIIKKENLNPQNIYYIGDETRDIVSAQKAGVKAVAVTWGVNSKMILEKYNPDHIISKPEELLLL